MRLLVVAATDSHLKWAAHLIERMPPHWEPMLVVLDNPGVPSPRQVDNAWQAVAGPAPAPIVGLRGLLQTIRQIEPHVLVLACTGPAIAALEMVVLSRLHRRPAIITAVPGIALPVRRRAVDARLGVDVFLAHSLAERDAFRWAFAAAGSPAKVALTTLPYLGVEPQPTRSTHHERQPVVFATQAAVPPDIRQRADMLRGLAAIDAPVDVHLRAVDDESTAHRERYDYVSLWDELTCSEHIPPGAIRFVSGPMRTSLARARTLLTISSTAALEAIALGIPVGIVADFGVDDRLLNGVFRESGCLVELTTDGVARAGRPPAAWLRRNYFHDSRHDDWVAAIEAAAEAGGHGRPRRLPTSTLRGASGWLVRSASGRTRAPMTS